MYKQTHEMKKNRKILGMKPPKPKFIIQDKKADVRDQEMHQQLNWLKSQVNSLKQEKLKEQESLLQHKKRFLSKYKNVLPEKERVMLIREIN